MPLSAGTRLGRYEILSPIGSGGMGEVYCAGDSRLERDVAIKILPEQLACDPQALARFEREAKAVAALSHPNILAPSRRPRVAGVAEGGRDQDRVGRCFPPRIPRASSIAI